MTDYTDLLATLMRRVDDAESEIVNLRRHLRGDFPPAHDGMSVDDRLDRLERSTNDTDMGIGVPLDPVYVSGAPQESADTLEHPAVDIEWANPTAEPDSTPVSIIEIQPCDKNGTPYSSADPIKVYIRSDRSTVDLSDRSWTTSTILSFMRFPWDVTDGADTVVGVLAGEGNQTASTPAGEADVRNFAYKAHYNAGDGNPSEEPFWTIPDALHSDIEFRIEIRECVGHGEEGAGFPAAKHPAYKGAIVHKGGTWNANSIRVWGEGADDSWAEAYAMMVLQNAMGPTDWSAYDGDPIFQVQVNADGDLQFRFHTVSARVLDNCEIVITARIIALPGGTDLPELGQPDALDFFGTPYCDHELGSPSDPEWNPETEATPFEWGDEKWRSL